MNRLDVRLSLAFAAVILLVLLLPVTWGVATRPPIRRGSPPPRPPFARNVPQETFERIREEAIRAFWLQILRAVLIGGTIGVGAGALVSRSLTAPLSKLVDAARAIGQRDLSRRVSVEGSEEIQALAKAFNEMATELEQAETLRQNLLTDVAHELRTPVSVIQGNLRAMLDGVYPLDQEEIARLYDQTRQMARLIEDLRQLAQAEANRLPLHMTSIDVVTLAAEAADTFRPLATNDAITLTTDLPAEPMLVRADRARLLQALHNLLHNALRHTPENGRIVLQLERDERLVYLHVHDTGEGIPPDHLPHVFDRFYRADPARSRDTGGSGLGLAIVRAIVQAHGGQITAQSDGPGQGSTFTITLPLGS